MIEVDPLKTESELIRAVQSGDKDAFNEIILKFEPLILSTVSEYLNGELFGADDRDDLYQEAAIALYSAAMSYDFNRSEATFGLYAKICLNNSLKSALRRRKRQLAADSAQYEAAAGQRESSYGLPDETKADVSLLLARIDGLLSDFERKVFRLYLGGYSHRFIAETLGRPEKSIDNAIYRIKKKLGSKLL